MSNYQNKTKDEISRSLSKISYLFLRLRLKKQIFNKVLKIKIEELIIKIQKTYRGYCLRKTLKTNLLINQLLFLRNKSACIIQKKFQAYYYIREFNKILKKERTNYSIYFYTENPNQEIILEIIISNNNKKNFQFEFCKARNIYVTYIDKKLLNPEIYLCSFIVNGITICDSRYPTVYSGKSFYNKIDFSNLNEEQSDEDEEFEDTTNHFFNLKNIEHYRKKIIKDIEEDKKVNVFNKKSKSSFTNLSLSNLKKAEVKQAKLLQYVKSLSELIKKEAGKPILRKNIDLNENLELVKSRLKKRVFVSNVVDIY